MHLRVLQWLTSRHLFLALLLCSVSALAHAGDLFVGNDGGGAVDRYDGTTGVFIGTLTTGFQPVGIAVDSGGTVYVANSSTQLIDEFNSNTGSLLGTISVPKKPQDLAFGPGNTLYVTSYPAPGVGSIYKVDLTTDKSTLFANLPEANGIVVASTGDIYATSFGGKSLSHYNSAGTLLGSVGLGNLGYGVTIGKDGFLYTVSTNAGCGRTNTAHSGVRFRQVCSTACVL